MDFSVMTSEQLSALRAAAEVGKGLLSQDEFICMFPGRFDEETVEKAARKEHTND